MSKPLACIGCPLEKKGKGFCKPPIWIWSEEQNRLIYMGDFFTPKLLIQGEAPGKNEIAKGEPFIGDAGFWLRRNILENAGLREQDVIFDNTIRCLVGGKSGAYPTGKERKAAEQQCRSYDIWGQFPYVPLLLAGSKAIGLFYESESVGRWHGSIKVMGTRLVMGTYHPAAVMRNPNLLPLVVQEVRNLMKAAQKPELLYHPAVAKGFLDTAEKTTMDLEWDELGKVVVVGTAICGTKATSQYGGIIDGKEIVEYAVSPESSSRR